MQDTAMSHEERARRRETMARRVKNGETLSDVAKDMCVTRNTVRQACIANGVPRNDVPPMSKKRRNEMQISIKKAFWIVNLTVENNLTQAEIARKVGTSDEWVRLVRRMAEEYDLIEWGY